MAVHWKLKTFLSTQHGIFSATELRKLIAKRTGVIISLQNLCNLINGHPTLLSLKTMEIICTGLDCSLADFLSITPGQYKRPKENKKLSYKNTPLSKRGGPQFPTPQDYQ